VGPKRAGALLHQFGTLEAILAAGQFADEGEDLKLYKKLATMEPTAPLPSLGEEDRSPNWKQAAALVRRWDLTGLANRLDELPA
jgi:DNA polymerase-1